MSKPKVAKAIALEYAKHKGISFKLFNHTDLRRIVTFDKKIMINNFQATNLKKFNNIQNNNKFTFKINTKKKYGRGVNINNLTKKTFNSNLISSWCVYRNNNRKRINLAESIYDFTLGLKPNNKLKYCVAYKNLKPIGSFLSSLYVDDSGETSRRYKRIQQKKINILDLGEDPVDKIYILQDMNFIKTNSRSQFLNYSIISYICSDKTHKGTGIALLLLEMTHLPKSCTGLIVQIETPQSLTIFQKLGFKKVPARDLEEEHKKSNIYFLKKELCTNPLHLIKKLDNNRENKWVQQYYKFCYRPKVQSLVTDSKNITKYNNKNTFKFGCL